jgi:hypothetical protein
VIRRILVLGAASATLAATVPATALGDAAAQLTLADRYAPVLRLVAQQTPCGAGEPYSPIDVEKVLGNDQVALRGPWSGSNLVKVAPTGEDISSGLPNYHLDFPGDALHPGCRYEEWQRDLETTGSPTTYARVVSQAGQTAVAYWFFYIYNDFNNKHEGDWEMIQLDFPAPNATAALKVHPSAVGYSQHDGAEEAAWDASKLEKVDGTHPVVYPAEGSHANYYEPALYLGASAGVGCDNTRSPWRELHPVVRLVPTNHAQMITEYPWLGYTGHWGEQHQAFYDGPTGPSVHQQWDQPITWAATRWHPSAVAVPGGLSGVPRATDLFCSGIAAGSTLLTTAIRGGPAVFLAALAAIVVLIMAVVRMRWRPSAPFHLARRRHLGQILSTSARMYRTNPRLYLLIGALFLPVSIVIALVQRLLFDVSPIGTLAQEVPRTNAAVSMVAVAIGLGLTPIALTIVQAMVASSMERAGLGIREPLPRTAYAAIRARIRSLIAALVVVGVVVVLLELTVVGFVVAAWLLVRWSLFSQCIVLEGLGWHAGLRRSSVLVRGHWWRVAGITIAVVGVALLLGPALGVILLLSTSLSLGTVNIVSAVVYVLTLPYAAIATTYIYYDLRVREQMDIDPLELPAEAALST